MTKTLSSISKKTVALVLAMLMLITFIPFTSVSMQADAASRATVVKYMRSMATIKWSSSKNITYWNYVNDKSETRKFKAGVTYTGMPYTQLNRKNLNQFQSQLSGTKYIGPTKYSSYYGNDCSWSVRCSWDQLGKGVSFSYTGNMFPGSGTGVRAVGSYKSSASTSSTKTITTKSGKSTMYAAYAQLKPGDAIMARHTPSKINHTRLVVSVSGSGENGKVKVIEQCGLSSSRGNTTWNVDKTYTFKQLYSTYYIPITSDALKGAKTDDAPPTGPSQLKISKYNTPPANLGLGKSFSIYGTITSNYTIKSVTVGIYNKNGVAVSEHKATPNSTSFSISTIDKYVKFAMAKAGKNTYRIKATDEKTTKTLVNKSYTVGSSSGNGSAATSTLSIKGYSEPHDLLQGSSFPIDGTVSSNYNIKSVTVGIYDAKGKAVSTKTVKPNAKSYSIAKLKSYVKFENANKGVNHYKVKATDEKQTKTLLDKKFNVAASDGYQKSKKEAVKSTLRIENYNYPTKTIKSGDKFDIKGDIMSNYIITSVTVGIYDKNDKVISAKTKNPKSKTYSIASLSSFIKFNKAPVGTYYYKVSATDKKKADTLLYVPFTVKEASTKSTLTITNFNFPSAFVEADTFKIKGTISSNYKIKTVSVGIYTVDGTKVAGNSESPNAKSYSLKNIGKSLKFDTLKAGDYFYRVKAKDEKGAATLINNKFNVLERTSSLLTKYFGISGDSTMFLYTSNNKDNNKISTIIDTGNPTESAQKTGEKSFFNELGNNNYLLEQSEGKYVIDYVILTHCHNDHISGLFEALDTGNYYVKNLIANSLYVTNNRKSFKKDVKEYKNKNLIGNIVYVSSYADGGILKNEKGKDVKIEGNWSRVSKAFLKLKIATDFNVTIFPGFKSYKNSKGKVGVSQENDVSMLLKFEYTKPQTNITTDYVFLGDIFTDSLIDICGSKDYTKHLATKNTTYLKINHHASRRMNFVAFGNKAIQKYMVDKELYKCKEKKEEDAKNKAKKLNPDGYNFYFSYNSCYYVYTMAKTKEVFDKIKECAIPKKKNGKTVKDENGNIVYKPGKYEVGGTTLTNYDEVIKSYFATGKNAELIGIGNIKARGKKKLLAADATTYFAIEGCDKYIDVRNTLQRIEKPSHCTVAIEYHGDTYTVEK